MNDLTFNILKWVLSISITIFTVYLIPFIRKQMQVKNWNELLKIVEIAVHAAEQTLTGGTVKKEDVTQFVSGWLSEHGLDISAEQLDKLIEAAVYTMNERKVQTLLVSNYQFDTSDEAVDDGK